MTQLPVPASSAFLALQPLHQAAVARLAEDTTTRIQVLEARLERAATPMPAPLPPPPPRAPRPPLSVVGPGDSVPADGGYVEVDAKGRRTLVVSGGRTTGDDDEAEHEEARATRAAVRNAYWRDQQERYGAQRELETAQRELAHLQLGKAGLYDAIATGDQQAERTLRVILSAEYAARSAREQPGPKRLCRYCHVLPVGSDEEEFCGPRCEARWATDRYTGEWVGWECGTCYGWFYYVPATATEARVTACSPSCAEDLIPAADLDTPPYSTMDWSRVRRIPGPPAEPKQRGRVYQQLLTAFFEEDARPPATPAQVALPPAPAALPSAVPDEAKVLAALPAVGELLPTAAIVKAAHVRKGHAVAALRALAARGKVIRRGSGRPHDPERWGRP